MSKSKTWSAPAPVIIDDTNLSRAWSRLLLHVLDGAGTEIAPMILSLRFWREWLGRRGQKCASVAR
jgi:hypothetical protein